MTDPQVCEHRTSIGSYPGSQSTFCTLPPRHEGEHMGNVYWPAKWPDCDTCLAQDYDR